MSRFLMSATAVCVASAALSGCWLSNTVADVKALPGCSWYSQGYTVPGKSMTPTITPGTHITACGVRGTYKPRRGDIVVFRPPAAWSDTGVAKVIKRVIGIGGDQVACTSLTAAVTLNRRPLDEARYLPKGVPGCYFGYGPSRWDVRVPLGYLLVMGDNRSDSLDSRAFLPRRAAFVPVGNVVAVYKP